MNYGLPYMGSKNNIARQLVAQMPPAEVFIDLFAGGCAVTHAAMLSGKYKRFIVNDITDAPRLFIDTVQGKFHNEDRWISREDFFRLKDTDPYVRFCWSFGNNGLEYIYGRHIEPYKKALHHAVFWGDFGQLADLCPEVTDACKERLAAIKDRKQRRIEIGRAVVAWLKAYGTPEMIEGNPLYKSCHRKSGQMIIGEIQSLNRLERLQSLECLQSLERLERLQSLENLEDLRQPPTFQVYQGDYQAVPRPGNAVVYCDPPYKGKGKYRGEDFDHERFYSWLRTFSRPVYVSEYAMPEDFVCVYAINKQNTICPIRTFTNTERLFVHKSQYNKIHKTDLFGY